MFDDYYLIVTLNMNLNEVNSLDSHLITIKMNKPIEIFKFDVLKYSTMSAKSIINKKNSLEFIFLGLR